MKTNFIIIIIIRKININGVFLSYENLTEMTLIYYFTINNNSYNIIKQSYIKG